MHDFELHEFFHSPKNVLLKALLYGHCPLDQNAKKFDIKGLTLSIKCFCILIQGVMPAYENYNVIAFKSCIQKFTVYALGRLK